MSEKMIAIRSDLADRLEKLAEQQGSTVDDILDALLPSPERGDNWALALAEEMEDADVDWQDEPHLSEKSRQNFEDAVHKKWKQSQITDDPDEK